MIIYENNCVKNSYARSPVTLLMSSFFQHPELQPDSLHPGSRLRRPEVTSSAVSSKLHLQVLHCIQYSTVPFASYSTELNQSLITSLVLGQVLCYNPVTNESQSANHLLFQGPKRDKSHDLSSAP